MTEPHLVPGRRLGRGPVRLDARTLYLGNYLDKGLPSPPPAKNWLAARKTPIDFGMYGNDAIGDCTCAAIGNMVRLWTAVDQGLEVRVTDQDVITAYSAITGYDPVTGAGDDGANELDVLRFWRTHGVAGHRAAAYVKVDHHNPVELRQAIYLFGGIYLGVALPISAQAETGQGKVWRSHRGHAGEPGSWGLHAVPAVAYNSTEFAAVTWGGVQLLTQGFFSRCVEEAYAILPVLDWTGPDGRSPGALDIPTLTRDLSALGKH